ncbi:choline transporter-like protein 1 isoform X2 [Tribolium madens]|uniref:choline transporter-like protein 1 isoform X2 n=1 Tax=Tribolium madens TaxID=41895 RepID=UPI001CF74790|nr:choline transporter-like protein 1 isoform X2 [Tribolium madens]
MGAKLSTGEKIQPQEFSEKFQRSESEASDDFKTKRRSTTDVCFLIFLSVFLTVLLCFLGYCICNGDIFRIINGYDNCGNVCGRYNVINHGEIRDEVCQESSTLSKPYHIIIRRNDSSVIERKCVSDCNDYVGYRKFFTRCVPIKSTKVVNTFFSKTGIKNFFQEVSEDFHLCWLEFLYLCLIALAFSILILFLFRYVVGIVVWVVLIGVVLACCIATIILWILWDQSRNSNLPENMISDVDFRKTGTYLAFAIIASVITVIVLLVIIVMRKRIELVVQLFKEAGKAVAAVPFLLLQPILTFLSLAVVIGLWFYFCLWIESSGYLTEKQPHVYYYEKDKWMKITRWYNVLAMLWMCQFVIGCQHMVIAGTVSDWYFTRNKCELGTPILKSGYNLVRYHLGSVALGSFLIAIVQFIRVILKFAEKYLHSHRGKFIDCLLKCCQCCLYCFEKILKYMSRNAYIEIAMYGYSFCQAGRQAFKLLVANVLRVTAINSVGDFVLFLGKVLVVAATVLIGTKMLQHKEGLQHMWVPLTLAGLFAYFVAHCFMTVYEMAIDTIFLCFCEDCEHNDGITKPYYMSRGLMEFVENSKKVLESHDCRQRGSQAWQEKVPSISDSVEKKI